MATQAIASSSTSNPGQQPPAPGSAAPLVAQGDWTKNLVQLAKTAELKKHALTLQLHTAHILGAHGQLDKKKKAIQDLKEQQNKLESERTRLLNCLREVNEDRDKADILEGTLNREINELQNQIQTMTDGEYATAKKGVDQLRLELGHAPLPSLQDTLEEKSSQYLRELRLEAEAASVSQKRGPEQDADGQPSGKRPRGRPKGSKNSKKPKPMDASVSS